MRRAATRAPGNSSQPSSSGTPGLPEAGVDVEDGALGAELGEVRRPLQGRLQHERRDRKARQVIGAAIVLRHGQVGGQRVQGSTMPIAPIVRVRPRLGWRRSMIDLRSDTQTSAVRPAMREAMANAEVGDEQEREDPTVNALEQKAAALLGQEEAV